MTIRKKEMRNYNMAILGPNVGVICYVVRYNQNRGKASIILC